MRANLGAAALAALVALAFSAEGRVSAAPVDRQEQEGPKRLRVAIKPVEPFVMSNLKAPAGYSVELWERVAAKAGLPFDYVPFRTTSEILGALADDKADVALGAISITADREAALDFSHSYFESGLQILVTQESGRSAFAAFSGLLKADVWLVVGVLVLALLVNSHLLWWMEHRRNPGEFPEGYAAGVWESAWWSVCTLITGGCENKSPAGIGGRLVAVVWMLAGVGLFSYITATIASTMTVNTLTSEIKGFADLRGKTVGTVEGSTAHAFLQRQGIEPLTFPNVASVCAAVKRGAVRAVVYDAPLLRFHLNRSGDTRLQLVGAVFDKQDYGFGLRPGSPYRKLINRALLSVEEDGVDEDLDKKWFGTPP